MTSFIPTLTIYTRPMLLIFLVTTALCSNTHAQVIFNSQELSNPNSSFIDRYGNEVETNGSLLLVGAPLDNSIANDAGRVYVYNADSGLYLSQLSSTNMTGGEHFGSSIAMFGNLALIGAPNDFFGAQRSGSAYFFNPSNGSELQYVGPSDGSNFDVFGNAVAMNNIISLISAPLKSNPDNSTGAVYAFLNSTMKELTKFTPPIQRGDIRFGSSLAITENFFIIGAPGNSDPATSFTGEVYVYDVNTGSLINLLLSDSPDPASQFGLDIDLDGTTAVVGAKTDDAFGPDAGAVYVFDIISGNQLAQLSSSNPQPGDNFGSSVKIRNGIIAVGSDREDAAGESSGAVYTFDAATFQPIGEAVPNQISAGSKLGASVTIHNQTVIAGADKLLTITNDSGNVYILSPFCKPDLNKDGNLDFFDVSEFLSLSIDWNEDGDFDFFDVSGFLSSFSAGCPELE